MKQTMRTTVSVGLLAIIASVAACTSKPVAEREPSSTYGRGNLGEAYFFDITSLNLPEVKLRKYDLNNQSHLASLERDLQLFLTEYKKRKDGKTADIEQNVVALDLKTPYSKFKLTEGSLKDGAEYMLYLFERVRRGEITQMQATYQIAAVSRAINLLYTVPVRSKYEFFALPVHIGRFLNSPDVSVDYKGQDPDLQFVREQFVQEKDISKIDMAFDHFFAPITKSCQYDKAKRGYGVHAGFHIKCGNKGYKMKFGNEEYSGPFNSRVYRSLGYVAPHINNYENLEIDYDRRLIEEFNDRLVMQFRLTFVGVPVYKKRVEEFMNPFTWIKGVKLKDGTFVDSATAQSRLFKRPLEESVTADMFDVNFEAQIDKFVFGMATLTAKDDPASGESIGPWVPDDFNFRDFKEVRGIAVLAAWSGNYDVRKDNLTVNVVQDKNGKKQLRFGFSDAGTGLGKGTGFKRSGSVIDEMEWEVSKVFEPMNTNDDRWPQEQEKPQLKLSGIDINEHAKAFANIKITDAQWMLRKLCQFSSEQIKSTLVASGLSSAETLLAHAKLLERRNKMIEHFNMDEDFKASCYVPVNRKMDYDPLKDPLVTIRYDRNTKTMTAPDRGHRIVKGRLLGVKER